MLVTKNGIRVVSFVHKDGALVDLDDLGPEDKARAATELRTIWMNELYRGKAVFAAEGVTNG